MNKTEEWINDYKNFELLIEIVNVCLADNTDICPITKELLDELVKSTELKANNKTLERIKGAFKKLEDEGFTTIKIDQLLKIINKSII